MRIRPERPSDRAAVAEVITAAFGGAAEAELVARLHDNGNASIALVAEHDGRVVGHVLFSPVEIVGRERAVGLGLAPVAVAPAHQRRGIGGQLIAAGLEAARRYGAPFVVVLGHSDYYPRFGFERADQRGIGNDYGATDTFFVLELTAAGLPATGGVAHYGAEFAES